MRAMPLESLHTCLAENNRLRRPPSPSLLTPAFAGFRLSELVGFDDPRCQVTFFVLILQTGALLYRYPYGCACA